MSSGFHPDLPGETREVWDILAKALMLRVGGGVTVTKEELRNAASTPCEIALNDDGSITLRVARQ